MIMRHRLLLYGLLPALALCAAVRKNETVLYEKQSPYSTIVVVEDDRGLRTLLFDWSGVQQSTIKVGDPDHIEFAYVRAMMVGLACVEQPKRMLVVGLGGGTIPMFLHRHYAKATIDAVDIDPDVVTVAKEFFGFREDATLRAFVDDGRRFIEKCQKPYDIIFLDAFGSEEIPSHLTTQEFLRAVRRALSPGGVVVANVWSRGSNRLYDSMVRTYQSVFEELYIMKVEDRGNTILMATPRKRELKREELVQRARAVSKEKGFRFDIGDLVTYGFHAPEETNFRGRVLTDKQTATRPG